MEHQNYLEETELVKTKKTKIGGAVFSDVEGTLINASLPEMALAVGKGIFVFNTKQIIQLNTLALVQHIAPRKLRRTIQLLSFLLVMPGQTPVQLEVLNKRFIPQAMQYIKPKTLEQLQQHQYNGLPLVLISAGLHESIAYLGQELQGRGEGTKFQLQNGKYIGKLDGKICQGEGKAERAKKVLEETGYDPSQSYAYGDTANDILFLELFGHPCAVDPDSKLKSHAQQYHWPVLYNS